MKLRAIASAAQKRLEIAGHISGIDKMVQGYLAAALWSSTDESDESGGEPLDNNYDINDVAQSSKQKAKKDCTDFVNKCKQEWLDEMDESELGHNFWLTRNGHGTGFWDRDELSDEAKKGMTDVSKKFGEINAYVGDDGKVYIE